MILLDLERTIQTGKASYWKAHKRGYTNDITEAGNYSVKEAIELVETDLDHRTVFISDETIKNILNA